MKAVIRFFILLIIIFWIFFGGLLTTRVIHKDLSIDKVKLIFDMPSIKDSISQHQKDARYLPYKLRLVVFNDSVYLYQILRNIANFWNLYNINHIFLLANLYPIYYGFKLIYKDKYIRYLCVLGIFSGSLVIGINKMVDARMASLFMMPIFVYLIFKGIKKINLKIYLSLLLVSVILWL